MNIGEKIKAVRTAAGMTQKALGEAAGMSQQRIAQYENGYRVPREKVVNIIARAIINSGEPGVLFWQESDDPLACYFRSFETLKTYLTQSDKIAQVNFSSIIDPFSKLNERGQAKVISYAWDLTESEKYTD